MPDITFDSLPLAVAELNGRLIHLEGLIEQLISKQKLNPKQLQEEYLTRKEAAAILKISLPTLHAWIKDAKIKGYRIASRVRLKRSEVEQFLKQIMI